MRKGSNPDPIGIKPPPPPNPPVPVEPKFREFRGCLKPVDRGMWVNGPSNFYSASEVDAAIETLQSALKLAQEELEKANNEFGSQTAAWPDLWKRIAEIKQYSGEQWRRAEKAEALAEQNRKDAERDAVLEEAAAVCDGWTHADGDRCAEGIRALKVAK